MQKRVFAFKVFDDAQNADNIFRMIENIFEEHKIFTIDFDNAFNNTTVIFYLINLCNPYFSNKFFH